METENWAESTSSTGTDEAQAMFNRHLATYRKVVGENLMFHREVYCLLHSLLSEEMPKPFKFLDIACGDASASAAALKGSAIGHYYGIDLSAQSLELARQSLKDLRCPIDLRCCDFAEAMADWSETVDLVWIGMSLHHLQPEGKVRLMKDVHDALGRGGLFLIWEPTLLEGENRTEWLDRFTSYRSVWAALTDEEFETMDSHMRLADFPESADTWKSMGREAGFAHAEHIYQMPNRFGSVYQFRN
ncbi:class I SAM-dependent methyltransferase [Rhizobium sp. BK251]|uniref:class I SAM-dependent methyltransferase n=1 Tax=Rhizobium sp. BK251 TaxID=2512125 RepID=UPI001046944B|nr:class I SAM-dependent methyltransferase [Rhizobium sp. BK251]TCL72602.1 ubiquinone/menaquinone biosynthesis C-methylase UbiE [Rhizobium sp. BK251]